MKNNIIGVFAFSILGLGYFGHAQETDDDQHMFDMSLEELLEMEVGEEKSTKGVSFYGFLAPITMEQVYSIPSIDASGQTVKEDDPITYADPEGFFYIKAWYGDFEGKVDLFATTDEASVEAATLSYHFGKDKRYTITAGERFRIFDLYNETLNHFIVFTGIEAPELFDGDHSIPRKSNLSFTAKQGPWQFYVDTGRPESGESKNLLPFGWDVRYEKGKLIVGTSAYLSSLTDEGTAPSVQPGEGSPDGGVLPWMVEDRYQVMGAFLRNEFGKFLLETAYWNTDHEATRDPAAVLLTAQNTNLNTHQRERFFGQNSDKPISDLTEADVVEEADFDVKTAYVRLGYSHGRFTYYLHWDWMDHPETIADKTWGGDNEAGISDDGSFTKWSLGGIWRPNKSIAVKVDSSVHVQDFNGGSEPYPEIRVQGAWAFNTSFK